jgi:endoglucanase
MKIKWLPVVFLIVLVYQVNAALKLQEVRTASNTVLVVYFESTIVNASEVNTADLSLWTINGQPATAINKYVMQADGCDHYIYLTVPQLVNDAKYDIKTPYGDTSIVFDDHAIFCESIKTNQAAYSSLCKSNYALFAVWLGDGGKKQINGDLPSYEVFEVYTGTVVAQGTLGQAVTDASTGESVHRINLSAVPEGGPYKIAVAGYGCSYPFGIGCDFSRRLAHIMFRAQYHQRCGCPVKAPYASDIRMNPCHTTIYDVDGAIGEANVDVTGTEPSFKCYGGYHDAGDADRRAYHISNPVLNLMFYEAFPDLYTDDQFNIPDKFDSSFNIVGKGNGVPDIIDEAEWGTLIWEYLQNTDGSIHFGTETRGYPDPFDAPMDKDAKRYGTVKTDDRPAAVAPGLFLHLARLLKPYNASRAEQLAARAQKSFTFIQSRIANPEKLYYYIQKYLYDGDEAAHSQVKSLASAVDTYKNNVMGTPGYSLNNAAFDNPAYIVSYMVEKTRPTDQAVVSKFTAALKAGADANIAQLKTYAYPVGNNPTGTSWGHNVRQPGYACAPLLYWRFSKEQSYFDAACNLVDYILGLNPLGISYTTGLGFHQVHNPHDRESAFTKKKGWGPKPGITVFGPGVSPEGTTVPAITSLPKERQFSDNLSCISTAEFTIFENMEFNALFTVLSNGGKWDETRDPFASQQLVSIHGTRSGPGKAGMPLARIRNGAIEVSLFLDSRERVRGSVHGLNGAMIVQSDFGVLDRGSHTLSFPMGGAERGGAGLLICRIRHNGAWIAKKIPVP